MTRVTGRGVVPVAGATSVLVVRLTARMAVETVERRGWRGVALRARHVVPSGERDPGVREAALVPRRIGREVTRLTRGRETRLRVIRIGRGVVIFNMASGTGIWGVVIPSGMTHGAFIGDDRMCTI